MFVSDSPWSARAVLDEVQAYVGEHLSEPEGAFLLNESGFVKLGKKSVGVARQYSGTRGKVDNWQGVEAHRNAISRPHDAGSTCRPRSARRSAPSRRSGAAACWCSHRHPSCEYAGRAHDVGAGRRARLPPARQNTQCSETRSWRGSTGWKCTSSTPSAGSPCRRDA